MEFERLNSTKEISRIAGDRRWAGRIVNPGLKSALGLGSGKRTINPKQNSKERCYSATLQHDPHFLSPEVKRPPHLWLETLLQTKTEWSPTGNIGHSPRSVIPQTSYMRRNTLQPQNNCGAQLSSNRTRSDCRRGTVLAKIRFR